MCHWAIPIWPAHQSFPLSVHHNDLPCSNCCGCTRWDGGRQKWDHLDAEGDREGFWAGGCVQEVPVGRGRCILLDHSAYVLPSAPSHRLMDSMWNGSSRLLVVRGILLFPPGQDPRWQSPQGKGWSSLVHQIPRDARCGYLQKLFLPSTRVPFHRGKRNRQYTSSVPKREY